MGSLPGWFDKKRGAVYGIVATGSSIGGVIFPIMISRLIPEVGFGWSMRIGAFMILALLIIANATIKTRLPPSPKKLTKQILLAPFFELKAMLLFIGFMFMTFGVFIPINYVEVEALHQGMGPNLAQYLIPILNAARYASVDPSLRCLHIQAWSPFHLKFTNTSVAISLFGRMASGIFADRIGAYNIFVVVCTAAGILVLGLWIPATGNTAIIIFAALFGFASGAYVSLATNLVVKISPFKEIGYRTGILFLFSSIGGLTTNPIAGAILQHSVNGSYRGMKIFAGVFLLVGTLFILGTRLCQTGLKLTAKF